MLKRTCYARAQGVGAGAGAQPEIRHLGCFRDAEPRLVASLEHEDERLDGFYKGRAAAVEKCAVTCIDIL